LRPLEARTAPERRADECKGTVRTAPDTATLSKNTQPEALTYTSMV
jgi:hypothetical protein